MTVRGAECGVRRAVRRAGCWVLGAVLSAGGVVLSAECGVLSASGAAQGPPGTAAALPEGEGVQVARSRCLTCHGADMIVSQRLTDAAWGREIDKMIRWGASVTEAERAPLQLYLAARFAPTGMATRGGPDAGEGVFKRACLACHGADMAEQQRLSPTGWTREVEKMMRWGAQLSEADKAALVSFLATRYPVR